MRRVWEVGVLGVGLLVVCCDDKSMVCRAIIVDGAAAAVLIEVAG